MERPLSKVYFPLFLLIFASVWVLIIYKAVTIPVTHDEVLTTTFYSNFNVWEIMQYPNPSPNNHILNTLLTKFVLLFGNDPWIIRLPNILFFVVYAFAAYRISNMIFDRTTPLFVLAASLFIANPYLLDFFSLSRGYGISVSLCLLSFSYLLSGYKDSCARQIWLSFGFALLASYANFTLLLFWAATTLLILVFFIIRFRKDVARLSHPFMAIIGISLAYLSLIFIPLKKMHSTDQFVHWSSNGFIEDTVKPLVSHSIYFTQEYDVIRIISYGVLVIILLSIIFVMLRLVRSGQPNNVFSSPFAIGTLLLALTIGINIIQSWIFGTPNLNGRTALFFFPMTVVIFLFLTCEFGKGIRVALLVLFTLLGVYNLLHSPTSYVREWEYDKYTYEVQEMLADQLGKDEKVSLSVHWIFHPSFEFYVYTGETPWLDLSEFDYLLDSESESDFYYARAMDEELLSDHFETIHCFENGNVLMKKKVLPPWSK